MAVKNPYSYGSRNNSGAFSSFSHRLPRFEYRAAPFAFTVTQEESACGGSYPYDRRGPSEAFDPVLGVNALTFDGIGLTYDEVLLTFTESEETENGLVLNAETLLYDEEELIYTED